MPRIKMLTNTNRTVSSRNNIDFIAIHYVGAVSTAKNNGSYFRNIYRGASAHYFVDENDIVQVVEEKDVSWHCGTNGTYYNGCRNSNSIGIELCCKKDVNGNWYFEQESLNNAIQLVKELLSRHPNAILCRHYDVTRKICPEPMIRNEGLWNDFKFKCYNQDVPNIPVSNNILKVVYPSDNVGLNVRSGPSTQYAKVSAIAYGTAINIYEILGEWGRTDLGFVHLGYTKDSNNAQVVQPKYVTGRYKVNTSAGLNIRSKPDSGASKVHNNKFPSGAYPNNQGFDVFEVQGAWGRSPSGWLCLDYCVKL